jgi:phosphatidylserine/phosphatidylglycerophosphate/cardiolipin synthase-like enzyme
VVVVGRKKRLGRVYNSKASNSIVPQLQSNWPVDFTDRFWNIEWPGTSRPNVLYDPRASDADGPSGVLHAKAVVTDDEVVFVTSASLTEAALDRNIELGVLIHDRVIALPLPAISAT